MWQAFKSTLIAWLSQKKALAAITAILISACAPIAERLGFEIDPLRFGATIAAIVAYIIGQGVSDHGKAAAEKNAQIQAVSMMVDGPTKTAAIHALAGIMPDSTKTADTITPPQLPVTGEITP